MNVIKYTFDNKYMLNMKILGKMIQTKIILLSNELFEIRQCIKEYLFF